ncbi:hypothetical protein PR048_016423 [Dryococelus australis]|uniref:Uncharacterized protein n=1 Tax=Dryococelus australis TaxID=614101 RepID=A0ABQ9HJN1_9NEOP|nr:hypothetical protein PR048_016423 [Dryococelus australis]
MRVIEVNMERRRNEGRGKREIPEKTRRPMASSGTIPTCENPVTRPVIEPGEHANHLTTAAPQHFLKVDFKSGQQITANSATALRRSGLTGCILSYVQKPGSASVSALAAGALRQGRCAAASRRQAAGAAAPAVDRCSPRRPSRYVAVWLKCLSHGRVSSSSRGRSVPLYAGAQLTSRRVTSDCALARRCSPRHIVRQLRSSAVSSRILQLHKKVDSASTRLVGEHSALNTSAQRLVGGRALCSEHFRPAPGWWASTLL